MRHLGDITKISGYHVPPADVIIGGSPCQDLSVAGRREGLVGERSGLFMEQIRIIKEMRNADKQRGRTGTEVQPRFMVWENVPGAFSSNHGEDFRTVLEETAKIADENAVIPEPPKGKWSTAGAIMGDGWSIAWRVLDAQFWGVPQRRRRIALVADFGGQSAPEILFEREGVSGDTAQSGPAWERTTAPFEKCSGTADAREIICMATQQGGAEIRTDGYSPTLTAAAGMSGNNQPVVCQPTYCIQGNCIDRADTAGCNGKGWKYDQCYTLNTIDRPAVYDARGNGDGNIAPCITGDHQNRITDYTAIAFSKQSFGEYNPSDVASPSKARDYKDATDLVIETEGTRNIVRRLTPLECERLQGYPDGWTDIGDWIDSKGKKRKLSDSARYKALGNSIALPPWRYVLSRLCSQIGRAATMASLFDGIGGFPLIWEEINGPGSCLWASEIEEFPIAVTSRRCCNEP